MRVLHVYRTYFPDSQGGLEEVIRQVCANTAPLGAESRVLSLSASPEPSVVYRPEAEVHRSRLSGEIASCGLSTSAFSLFKQLSAWADVIHYHFPWPFADLLHFSTRHGKPTLVTYHSDIVRQRILSALYRPLMKRFLSSADRIVCTSPNYLATSKVLRHFQGKVDVIPIGIDEGTYKRGSDETLGSSRKTFGEDFFLFVGVLRYYKGLHILLEAVKEAPYHVIIAGSGPTESELRRQADDLGLSNVTFTGYVPDKEKFSLFELCRGVVFPSYMRSEAFGVTLLEGAMYRKPLISTEVGSGTSHVNIHGETGLVVRAGSAESLRQAMDYLWNNPEIAQGLGARARERYERLFTGKVMGQRYFDLYQELTGQVAVTAPASSERVRGS